VIAPKLVAGADNRLEAVRKAHWGIAEGTAAPDGENSRRGAEGEWGGLLAGLR
jgi:hypothetical protein